MNVPTTSRLVWYRCPDHDVSWRDELGASTCWVCQRQVQATNDARPVIGSQTSPGASSRMLGWTGDDA